MRNLVILTLSRFITDSDGHGIPRNFDCDESDYITDANDLLALSDEQLLDCFEACIGFRG